MLCQPLPARPSTHSNHRASHPPARDMDEAGITTLGQLLECFPNRLLNGTSPGMLPDDSSLDDRTLFTLAVRVTSPPVRAVQLLGTSWLLASWCTLTGLGQTYIKLVVKAHRAPASLIVDTLHPPAHPVSPFPGCEGRQIGRRLPDCRVPGRAPLGGGPACAGSAAGRLPAQRMQAQGEGGVWGRARIAGRAAVKPVRLYNQSWPVGWTSYSNHRFLQHRPPTDCYPSAVACSCLTTAMAMPLF